MSRGPGIVQRRLLAAFQAEPSRRFTMLELAEVAWPGEVIVDKGKPVPGTEDVARGRAVPVPRRQAGRLGLEPSHKRVELSVNAPPTVWNER